MEDRRRPKADASLERATKSPDARGQVSVTVLPEACEVLLSCMQGRREGRRGTPGVAQDPARCRDEAIRRAGRQLRRFAKQHRLCFMWTLTYGNGGQRDVRQLRRQVERLVAKVAEERGERFPYAYVAEYHEDDERLHVHMAVPFFFDHGRLGELWTHGFVWCTDKRRRGECRHVGAIRAASYLAKYVGKTFDESAFGRHRYDIARGFKVASYQVRRRDLDEGQRYAEDVFGSAPDCVWNSADCNDWAGPPVRVLFFTLRRHDE
jgi:hypothetical protein